MRARFVLALAVCLIIGGCDKAQPNASASRNSGPCEVVEFAGSRFTDCIADPARHRIRLVLDGADGQPLRRLSGLPERNPDGTTLAFAMNAGMFDEQGEPIGLFVTDGEQSKPLNRKSGPGNFHMLPNGVFFGDSRGWHVEATDTYARNGSPAPRFATQSGPMLLIAGKLHPSFSADGDSRYVRNSVGIDRRGRAHFVISEEPVSFGKLARLYRDKLGSTDALYFDGYVSSLRDPGHDRIDEGPLLGPMVVVESARTR